MSFCIAKKIAEPLNPQCNKSAIYKEKSLSDLVKDYLKHYGHCYQNQAQWWGDQALDWDAALERAWKSRLGAAHAENFLCLYKEHLG